MDISDYEAALQEEAELQEEMYLQEMESLTANTVANTVAAAPAALQVPIVPVKKEKDK